LNVMIADEAKFFLLGEDGGFVVEGTVPKMEDEVSCDAVPMNGLDRVAAGDDLTLLVADDEEAVNGAQRMADRDGIGDGEMCEDEGCAR